MWYKFIQSLIETEPVFDASRGISMNLYIEAEDLYEAKTRVKDLGIRHFDPYEFEGGWSRPIQVDAPPGPDEDLVETVDRFQYKWVDDDYDSFVHPKHGDFYGAHRHIVNGARYGGADGYGVIVGSDSVSEVFPVSSAGWDETGRRHVPAHGSFGPGVSVDKVSRFDGGFASVGGGPGASLWFEDESHAESFRVRVQRFMDERPKFDHKNFV